MEENKITDTPIIPEEGEETLTPEQQEKIVNTELSLVASSEKAEIVRVTTTQDILLINKHKQKITSFKRKYPITKFTFNKGDAFDKELYDKVIAAWRDVKAWRTKNVVPDFKALKSPLNAALTFYNNKEKPIIEELKKIEDPLGDIVDLMEAAKKLEDQREENERKERTNRRVDELIKSGAVFNDGYYEIGSEEFGVPLISLGMSDINSQSEDTFNLVLSQIATGAAIIHEKQKAKDDAILLEKQQEEDKRKLEKEQLENDKKALKEQNSRVRARELKSLGFVFDAGANVHYSNPVTITVAQVEDSTMVQWEELIADAEVRIEDEKIRSKFNERVMQLKLLGFTHGVATSSYLLKYKETSIALDYEGIKIYDTDAWDKFISRAKEVLSVIETKMQEDEKAEKEKKELAKTRENVLAPYWQFVNESEKKSLPELTTEAFESLLEDKVTAYQKKLNDDLIAKQEKDKIAEKEALAKQGDEAMFNDYVTKLCAVELPEVTTEDFKKRVEKIAGFLKTVWY